MHQLNLKKKQKMMMNTKRLHNVFLSVVLAWSGFTLAQENTPKDSLDTQLVKVVKPYTPKISDAFKLKQPPSLDDQQNRPKQTIEYTIYSIPVASTFTPAKSKSIGLEQLKKEKKFSNIASLSGGNYTSIKGDLFLNKSIAKGKNLSTFLSHQSSQGGIEDMFLDDGFSTNTAQFKYAVDQRSLNWNVGLNAQRFMTNWYGLAPEFDVEQNKSFDAKQVVSIFEAKGGLNINEGVLDAADLKVYKLSDDFDTNEIRAQLNTKFNLNILDQTIQSHVNLDVLKGNFDQNYTTTQAIDYGNLTASIIPSYKFERSNLILNLGLKTVYLNDTERSKQKFYVYPNISASYAVVNSILIAYAGIEGDLMQNTYRDLYAINSFVFPTLNISPTLMPYKFFLGTKGKLSNSFSYDVSGVFSRQNDAVFFQKNTPQISLNQRSYQYGNSFGIVYDNLETLTFQGTLNFDLSDKFNFVAKTSLSSYNLSNEKHAWNLPEIQSSVDIRYHPTDRLNLGLQGFYYGARYDLQKFEPSVIFNPSKITKLDAFLDLNIDASYMLTPRWTVTLKLNNVLGKNYQRWMHYPVQGVQVSAGAFYKFDF